jgi:hypothetical protein
VWLETKEFVATEARQDGVPQRPMLNFGYPDGHFPDGRFWNPAAEAPAVSMLHDAYARRNSGLVAMASSSSEVNLMCYPSRINTDGDSDSSMLPS